MPASCPELHYSSGAQDVDEMGRSVPVELFQGGTVAQVFGKSVERGGPELAQEPLEQDEALRELECGGNAAGWGHSG